MAHDGNAAVVLVQRPGAKRPVDVSCFQVRSVPEPPIALTSPNEVIVETINFSMDPILRRRLDDDLNLPVEYLITWPLDAPIIGLSGVGRIIASTSPNFKKGDFVGGFRGWLWQHRQIFKFLQPSKAFQLVKLNDQIDVDIFTYGISALTAYLAITKAADCVLPASGQVAVVSGAAGSVGIVASQVLLSFGCEVVIGIVGSTEKAEILQSEKETYCPGIAAVLSYQDADFASKLERATGGGVDIFVDGVGGRISRLVRRLMKKGSCVISIGSMATMNNSIDDEDGDGDDDELRRHLKLNRVQRHNFAIYDCIGDWSAGLAGLRQMAAEGGLKLPTCRTRHRGLESAASSFVGLFAGENIGKQVVYLE